MTRPDWLAAHPECAFIEGLLAVVQADDAVTEEETTLLGGLLDAYGVGGTDAEREAWFHGRVDPAAVADDLRDPLARRFLLDRAFLLAGADGHLADAELALAELWAGRWGISAAELQALRDDAMLRAAQVGA